MNIKLDGSKLIGDAKRGVFEADLLIACATVVLEDYLKQATAEEFARRFGTVGTEALAKYSK